MKLLFLFSQNKVEGGLSYTDFCLTEHRFFFEKKIPFIGSVAEQMALSILCNLF